MVSLVRGQPSDVSRPVLFEIANGMVAAASPRPARPHSSVLAFTLLDAVTLDPATSMPLFATDPAVTIDRDDIVWVIAGEPECGRFPRHTPSGGDLNSFEIPACVTSSFG